MPKETVARGEKMENVSFFVDFGLLTDLVLIVQNIPRLFFLDEFEWKGVQGVCLGKVKRVELLLGL